MTIKTTPLQPTGVKPTRTYPQLAATIVINEIQPRVKKYKLTLQDFPVDFCRLLIQLEFNGSITRKDHRRLLDEHCEWVLQGRPRDKAEDEALLKYIKEKL